MEWIIVLGIGLLAGTLGGIVGFGTSIMLLSLLVVIFGPLEAVPMMAVTALMANFSRVAVSWREVDWKVCAAYGVPGIPCAALGATTLLSLNSKTMEVATGIFFVLMIPVRHWLPRFPERGSSVYQPLTRFLYSPVRVSISILSPVAQNKGTGISKPVFSFAGLRTLPEVSPRTAGSV